jgi:demethylmenaquinone methyltransferase/2-methoxy-6-polyprenyl-1,4-benzoquinol methylase
LTQTPDHSFGFRAVAAEERRARIRRVFSGVAARYDLMNDLMSFGLHRLWKRSLVAAVAARDGETIVDLAGGTGDVAAKLAGPDRRVAVCDPSVNMMAEGRKRQPPFVNWIAGEAEAMPFADASVDCVTISFGIRNVTRLRDALAEMHRVLKPGGRLLCLEFSRPQAWLKPFYDLFSFQVIPRLGAMVAQEPEAYAYLVESIRRFPDQQELARLFSQAGFTSVRYRNYSFGIVCLHVGSKE